MKSKTLIPQDLELQADLLERGDDPKMGSQRQDTDPTASGFKPSSIHRLG